MIKIVFKNLFESEIAKDVVHDRIQPTLEKFPDLENHKLTFTLSMDNSPTKPGPDLFIVKLIINGHKYKNIILNKSSHSLYIAIADISEHLLERLNRHGDKSRVKNRNQARKINQHKHQFIDTEEFPNEEAV